MVPPFLNHFLVENQQYSGFKHFACVTCKGTVSGLRHIRLSPELIRMMMMMVGGSIADGAVVGGGSIVGEGKGDVA